MRVLLLTVVLLVVGCGPGSSERSQTHPADTADQVILDRTPGDLLRLREKLHAAVVARVPFDEIAKWTGEPPLNQTTEPRSVRTASVDPACAIEPYPDQSRAVALAYWSIGHTGNGQSVMLGICWYPDHAEVVEFVYSL